MEPVGYNHCWENLTGSSNILSFRVGVVWEEWPEDLIRAHMENLISLRIEYKIKTRPAGICKESRLELFDGKNTHGGRLRQLAVDNNIINIEP